MGVIFSNNEACAVLARYENGLVYAADGGRILGGYDSGYIFNVSDEPIAFYSEGKVRDIKEERCILYTTEGCILQNERVIAKYQGGVEGACAAVFLLYEERLTGNRSGTIASKPNKIFSDSSEETQSISLAGLWTVFDLSCPKFLKIVVALFALASVYFLYQLPATIALLLESAEIGMIMLTLWGGAFLLGLRKCWDPWIEDFPTFLGLLWKLLVYYLHASWISIVFTCIYAAHQGYFSSWFLSSMLTLFPSAALYLTLPLFALQFVRIVYVVYKQGK